MSIALEMARKCMEQRGYCVVGLPFPLHSLPHVQHNGLSGEFGSVDSPVVAISETDLADCNAQADLLDIAPWPDEQPAYFYRVVAE